MTGEAQKTRPPWFYDQSAAFVYREGKNGVEVLLVRNRSNTKWIIPKGIVEADMNAEDSAAKEVWEEAGVRGPTHSTPLGMFTYQKWGGACEVTVFALKAKKVFGKYPEAQKRARKWFTLKDAIETLAEEELKLMAKKLPPKSKGKVKEHDADEPPKKLYLTLVRHSRAKKAKEGLADYDRPLSKRGIKDAPEIARLLVEKEVRPAVILASPSERTKATAYVVADALGYPGELIEFDEGLYGADTEILLDALKAAEDTKHHVMIVGHDPGLTELLNLLARENDINLPTSGAAMLMLDITSWKDVAEGKGKILFREKGRG